MHVALPHFGEIAHEKLNPGNANSFNSQMASNELQP